MPADSDSYDRENGTNGKYPKQRQFSKRPVRPDFTARDAQLGTLQAKVKEFMELQKAKAAELDALQNENKASNKLESLKRSLANAQHSRSQAQKLIDMTKKRLEDVSNPKSAKAPKSKGLDLSPQDILDRMEQLKDKVSNEPDPDEANRLIARIQALNASYVQLMGTDAPQGPSGSTAVKPGLEEDLQKYGDELKTAMDKEAELRDQLTELREQLDASQPHIERLRKERETCQTVVRSLRDKITAINDEWQAKFDEYKAAMDAWFAEKDEVMKEREEQKAQEQKSRAEEREQREREAKGPPFCQQIMACEQLLGWCKQYEKVEAKADAAAPSGAAPAAFEGMAMMSKRTPEGDGDVFATSRTKSKKRDSRRSRNSVDARAPAQKLQHDMDTLALLSKLKLPVPTSASDVPALADAAAQKKEDYEAKQKRALAGEDVPADDEAATPKVATGGSRSRKAESGGGSGRAVGVNMRCDEAFGMVLVELAVH